MTREDQHENQMSINVMMLLETLSNKFNKYLTIVVLHDPLKLLRIHQQKY